MAPLIKTPKMHHGLVCVYSTRTPTHDTHITPFRIFILSRRSRRRERIALPLGHLRSPPSTVSQHVQHNRKMVLNADVSRNFATCTHTWILSQKSHVFPFPRPLRIEVDRTEHFWMQAGSGQRKANPKGHHCVTATPHILLVLRRPSFWVRYELIATTFCITWTLPL